MSDFARTKECPWCDKIMEKTEVDIFECQGCGMIIDETIGK